MSDPMTIEECRMSQRECSRRVSDDMAKLRLEVKEDIGLIRDAVQTIDRAVSAIKGYLGLNGNGPTHAPGPHPHKRDSEDLEHLHRRITDLIKAQEAATANPTGDWRVKIMWGLGIFIAGAIATPILGAIGHAIAQRLEQ